MDELARAIWNADDPGEAMMHLHDNPLLQTLQASQGTAAPIHAIVSADGLPRHCGSSPIL